MTSSESASVLTIRNTKNTRRAHGLTVPIIKSDAVNKEYVDYFITYCYYSSSLTNPIFSKDITLNDKTTTTWTFTILLDVKICEITVGVTSKITVNINVTFVFALRYMIYIIVMKIV